MALMTIIVGLSCIGLPAAVVLGYLWRSATEFTPSQDATTQSHTRVEREAAPPERAAPW